MWLLEGQVVLQGQGIRSVNLLFPNIQDIVNYVGAYMDHDFHIRFIPVYESKDESQGHKKEKPEPLMPLSRYKEED